MSGSTDWPDAISDAEIELAALCFGGPIEKRVEERRVLGEVLGLELVAGRDDLELSYKKVLHMVASALAVDVDDLRRLRHLFPWADEMIDLLAKIDGDSLLARLTGRDAKARGAVLARVEQAIMRRSEAASEGERA